MRDERAARAALAMLCAGWLWAVFPTARVPHPPRPVGEGVERLLWGGRLDPNRAPVEALRVLPGIGPGRAAAIVAARPFCAAADVRRVRGIGPVTWSRIRDSLEVRDRPKQCPGPAASSGPAGGR